MRPKMMSQLGMRVLALVFAMALLLIFGGDITARSGAGTASNVTGAVIDENDRVVLHGNVPPKARAEFEVGRADPAMPENRVILVLKRAPEKETELEQFLAEQLDRSSPNFHHWLSAEEYGERFGPSLQRIAVVKSWLISHGFAIDEVAKGRNWVNFSGTVAQVEQTFRTQIHDYNVEGHVYHANSTDPSVPRALADIVAGPVTLHNFPRKAMHTPPRPSWGKLGPQWQSSTGSYELAPDDFRTIYNVKQVYNNGYDGSGVTIAIVGRYDTPDFKSDWAAFQTEFNPYAPPPAIICNGECPSICAEEESGKCSDESESDLDVEWAGAVAKGAAIVYVTSQSTNSTDGVDLSAQYIVDNKLAPIMSESYETCETAMSNTELQLYNSTWQQAAGEGISVFVSSGDNGAYECGSTVVSVNGLASTAYNVAVGGTEFANQSSASFDNYWDQNGNAKGYIPETSWNDVCEYIWSASGGGASSIYQKPAWQKCAGVPSDGMRDLPDVALNADCIVGYLIQFEGSPYSVGGTSASSPSFAGIMALIVQSVGGEWQGNPNPVFYQLGNAQYSGASGASTVFHDITTGNNGYYDAGPGYDQVTGLGSVDAGALVSAYGQEIGGFLTVTISPAVAVAAGAMWNVDGGPWQSSGATVSDLAVGSHTVSFKPVSGWTTPPNQAANITAGSNLSIGGTYVPPKQSGSLHVTITPPAAVSAGAMWNVDGGAWQTSGATVSNLAVGSHTVSFNSVTGWTTPANRTITISAGRTTTATGTYVQSGSLSVTITPPAAVSAGAMWNVDGGSSQSSGATVSDLTVGSHTVSFKPVSGWTTPANRKITISAGRTTTATGTYLPPKQSGSLQVTISPSAAVSAGAMWNVDGDPWQSSGATVSDLTVGSHTVSFKLVSGWTTPANQTVTISKGATASVTGTYAPSISISSVTPILAQNKQTITITGYGFGTEPPATVSLGDGSVDTVACNTTTPSMAIHDNASGSDSWAAGRETCSNLDAIGIILVSWTNTNIVLGGFGSALGNASSPSAYNIAPGDPITVDVFGPNGAGPATYSLTVSQPQTGSLQVTISPAAAVAAGAMWNVDGGAWQSSGATVSSLAPGSHTVSFNAVSGWITPANQTVTISSGATTTATGTYVQQPPPPTGGSLTVTITPAAAVTAGAMWNVDGGAWQSSGATVSGLTVGSHIVSFSTVSGWTTPANQTVTISSGATTTATGTYVPTISISSVTPILPQNNQTITITGYGFGATPPQTVSLGDGSVDTVACNTTTPSMVIHDNATGSDSWAAGRETCSNLDAIGIILVSWTDTEIVLGGFGSALGNTASPGVYNIAPGDPLLVEVWGPNGAGPAMYSLNVSQPTGFSDNFTEDQSLNPALWVVNGPVASAALTNFDSPPASMVTPTLAFSATQGLGMSGINGTYEQSGIQSIQSFTPPFTATAVGMTTSARPELQFVISSQNGGSGVGIIGGEGNTPQWIGFWCQSPSGPGTYWNQVSKLYNTAPQLSVWYTLTIAVDATGNAVTSVSSGGATIGQSTVSVGTGPFYVILSQGSGEGAQVPQTYWSSAGVSQ